MFVIGQISFKGLDFIFLLSDDSLKFLDFLETSFVVMKSLIKIWLCLLSVVCLVRYFPPCPLFHFSFVELLAVEGFDVVEQIGISIATAIANGNARRLFLLEFGAVGRDEEGLAKRGSLIVNSIVLLFDLAKVLQVHGFVMLYSNLQIFLFPHKQPTAIMVVIVNISLAL